MNIVFVARQPPLPADNGDRIRSINLIRHLSKSTSLHLVLFDRQPGTDKPRRRDAQIAGEVPEAARLTVVRAPAARKRLRQAFTAAGAGSFNLELHSTPRLDEAVGAAVRGFCGDCVVHYDSLFLGPRSGRSPDGAPVVVGMHNDESALYRSMAASSPTRLRRHLYRREAEAVAELEQTIFSHADAVVAVSDEEAQAFRRRGAAAFCVPNGVTPVPRPALAQPTPDARPTKLVFVGAQDYEPNVRGLEWFMSEVYRPFLGHRGFTVYTAGSGRTRANDPEITSLGRLDDIRTAYELADVVIVPLLSGGGTRLKVGEALASGVPLVSTELGATGYGIVSGVEAGVADSPARFAEELLALQESYRSDCELVNARIDAAYTLAASYFWPVVGDRLLAVYDSVTARPTESEWQIQV